MGKYSCTVVKSTRVRKAYPPGSGNPSIWGEAVTTLQVGEKFESDMKIEKQAVGGSKPEASGTWMQVSAQQDFWTAAVYNGEKFVDVVDNGTAPVLTHTIDVFSDGSIKIDGNPNP